MFLRLQYRHGNARGKCRETVDRKTIERVFLRGIHQQDTNDFGIHFERQSQDAAQSVLLRALAPRSELRRICAQYDRMVLAYRHPCRPSALRRIIPAHLNSGQVFRLTGGLNDFNRAVRDFRPQPDQIETEQFDHALADPFDHVLQIIFAQNILVDFLQQMIGDDLFAHVIAQGSRHDFTFDRGYQALTVVQLHAILRAHARRLGQRHLCSIPQQNNARNIQLFCAQGSDEVFDGKQRSGRDEYHLN